MPARTAPEVRQRDCTLGWQMNPQPLPTTSSRPNRVLAALAAAWIVLSFAIGGAVSAGDGTPEAATTSITGTAQP